MACPPKRAGHDEKKCGTAESITRILSELGVRLDLGLRDREQDLVRRVGGLRVPGSRGELTESDQVLTALAFRRHLEQTLLQNCIPHLLLCQTGSERLRRREHASAEQVEISDRRSCVIQLVVGLILNEIPLTETEPG